MNHPSKQFLNKFSLVALILLRFLFWCGGALLFLGLSLKVTFAPGEIAQLERMDQTILNFISHYSWQRMDPVVVDLMALGSPTLITVFALLGLLVMWLKNNRQGVLYLTVGYLGTGVWALLARHLFSRVRPEFVLRLVGTGGVSAPSSHALATTAFFLLLAILASGSFRSYLARLLVVAVAVLLIGLVSVSPLFLAVQYPRDVLNGMLLGAAWAFALNAVSVFWKPEKKVSPALAISPEVGVLSFAGFVCLFCPSQLWAEGYERAVIWSGQYAGLGGAATSIVTGPEALFFNPAALAGIEGLQVVGNFSPTFSQSSAPVVESGTSLDSDVNFSPANSEFVGYEISPKWGVGIGFYLSSSSSTRYSDVDFSTGSTVFSHLKADSRLDLTFTELSAGSGYEVVEGLRLGVAYRIVFMNANLALPAVATLPSLGSTLEAIQISHLGDTSFGGFRFGIQYSPKEAYWGFGLQLRTEVGVSAVGTASGSLLPDGETNPTTLTKGPATLATVFPMQVALGGFYDLKPDIWKVVGEYTFTQYNRDSVLALSGNLTDPTRGTTLALPSVVQNWTNQNNFRFGTQYSLMPAWTIRAGYVLTTQVVPNSRATPTFSSPGLEHTFVLGAGTALLPTLNLDLALEYSTAAGVVVASDAALSEVNTGNYSSHAYAAHLGLRYSL